MNKTHIYILVIAVTICLLATAGYTVISDTRLSAAQTIGQPQAVSFNVTPVNYVNANGVLLGYREFGSGDPILMIMRFGLRIPETKKLFERIKAIDADPTQSQGIRKEAHANLAWNGTYDGLSGIQKDVMLVVGTADDITPDAVSVRVAGKINGSWLVRFKGLPHVGSNYAPVEYGENALTFLGMDESPLSK